MSCDCPGSGVTNPYPSGGTSIGKDVHPNVSGSDKSKSSALNSVLSWSQQEQPSSEGADCQGGAASE